MSGIKKISIAIAAATMFGSIAFANGGTVPAQQPNHSWFVGIGGGYSNTQYNHNYNISSTATTPGIFSSTAFGNATVEDDADNLFPTVEAGFFKSMNNPSYFWGVKGIYDYLNSSTDSGSLNSVLRTKVSNLFSLLLVGGENLNADNAVTFGIGPAVGQEQENIHVSGSFISPNSGLPTTSGLNISEEKTAWGGTAQLALMHDFSPTCFVTVAYDYTVLEREKFQHSATTVINNAPFPNGTVATVANDSVRANTQQLTITLDHRFNAA